MTQSIQKTSRSSLKKAAISLPKPTAAEVSKANILKAASDLFLEGGVQAMSARAIAQRAGVSTIGIYSHFKGKQGILDALYIEGFERLKVAMDVYSVKKKTPLNAKAAVLQACRNYLDWAEKFEAHYLLVFGQPVDDYVPSTEARHVAVNAFGQLIELIGRLLPSNTSNQQRQDAAIQIWSIVHGFVSLRQHTIAKSIDMSSWKVRAIDSLDVVIDAIVAAQGQSSKSKTKASVDTN